MKAEPAALAAANSLPDRLAVRLVGGSPGAQREVANRGVAVVVAQVPQSSSIAKSGTVVERADWPEVPAGRTLTPEGPRRAPGPSWRQVNAGYAVACCGSGDWSPSPVLGLGPRNSTFSATTS